MSLATLLSLLVIGSFVCGSLIVITMDAFFDEIYSTPRWFESWQFKLGGLLVCKTIVLIALCELCTRLEEAGLI